jgi:uroporphyrinogen III methyltransferase/synthase
MSSAYLSKAQELTLSIDAYYMLITQSLPLINTTILVTRPEGQGSTFSSMLTALGADVLEMPALAIVPPSSWDALDTVLAELSSYDWLVLTSANGVDYFTQRLHHNGYSLTTLSSLKIAVVGKKTAQSLQQLDISPTLVPPEFVADSLVAELCQCDDILGKRILFPRVESGGRDVLVQELTARGAIVTEVPAYQSGCPEQLSPAAWTALQAGKVNVVTFTSSKTVRCFWQLLAARGATLALLDGVAIASIGPQTSKTCCSVLGRVDIEAQEFTMDGLVQAIVQAIT